MVSDTLPGRALPSTKLADLIAHDLRMWIIQGRVAEGSELPTLERLAARYGVSFAVVREAVRILEAENLLRIRRGAKGGVTVHAPGLDTLARNLGLYLQYQQATVQDLLTAQLGIQPLCAGLLAAKPNAKVLKTLSSQVDRAEGLLDDVAAFSRANTEFQHTIVTLTGNKTLTAIHAAIVHLKELEVASASGQFGRRFANPAAKQKFAKSIERKRRLIELIAAADAAGAEAHWREYLQGQTRFMVSLDEGKLVIDLFAAPKDGEVRRNDAPAPAPRKPRPARTKRAPRGH